MKSHFGIMGTVAEQSGEKALKTINECVDCGAGLLHPRAKRCHTCAYDQRTKDARERAQKKYADKREAKQRATERDKELVDVIKALLAGEPGAEDRARKAIE